MPRLRLILAFAAFVSVFGIAVSDSARGQEGAVPPHWIWNPVGREGTSFPAATRYFRKAFSIKEPSRLALEVTADDEFTLYLDGTPVASGTDWRELKPVEVKLAAGPHLLAAEAKNAAPGAAGFLVRGSILPLGQGVPIHTDSKWKTSDQVSEGKAWTTIAYNDSKWVQAVDLGVLGTGPWTGVTTAAKDAAERFQVPKGFKVETVGIPAVTGSVVAFTFDHEGRPCVSIERGPIARLFDDNGDGKFDRREVIAPGIENCQGLSFVDGVLYAVGHGPKGAGIYRLTNPDHKGVYREISLVHESKGGMGEHGPHAIMRGPDGKLYFDNGNHAHLKPPIDSNSPVNIAYEGELLPHYNDARGHAAGIMAPGGEIYRSDDEGKTWKRVVAGFRNQYDFGFNRSGELFTFDSDMEWDIGLPWYRPVRVNFCPIGAEFGWRNGSGKWPAYYVDSLPSVADVGRGSPTGTTFYHANQLPAEYADSFLICDWSQGRILAVQMTADGAGYRGETTVLVSGQPLNCTDIEAGPDGAVYFSTGGRGTQGGLFRVSWPQGETTKSAPKAFPWNAIEIDSPLSSYSQKRLADLKVKHAADWKKVLSSIAQDKEEKYTEFQRIRALDLLAQFGPEPTDEFLAWFAQDRKPAVRGRAAALLGLRSSDVVRRTLTEMLLDSDPSVVRRACEGLLQQPAETIPSAKLIPLLAHPDRWVQFATRIALEHSKLGGASKDQILALAEPRALVAGLIAVVRSTRIDEVTQAAFLKRETALLKSQIEPRTRIELLRLIELTYLLGPKKSEAPASAELRPVLLSQFTTNEDSPANRELARLLAYLDEPAAVRAILKHQASVADHAAQIHDSYCLRAMKQGWTADAKQQAWAWFETASKWDGGFSFLGYLDFMIQDLLPHYSEEEKDLLLAKGEQYPFPTRVLVRSLDIDSDSKRLAEIASLARRLVAKPRTGASAELRDMIVEKLAKGRTPEARKALRELAKADSAGRDLYARLLASKPSEQDLPILVAALESADPNTIKTVIGALKAVSAKPSGPEGLGNLIKLVKRQGPESLSVLADLGRKWADKPPTVASSRFEDIVAAWERAYREQFPKGPSLGETASSAMTSKVGSYSLDQLVKGVVRSPELRKKASAKRGEVVIEKVRCLNCHKYGPKGQGVGPDLTTLNSRFGPAEILESIVEPSKVISDQYKSTTVATSDGKVHNGMPVVNDAQSLVLLLSDGTKVTIPKADIEEQKDSKTSVMPEGLLNTLSLQEIADLIALFESAPKVAVPAVGAAAK